MKKTLSKTDKILLVLTLYKLKGTSFRIMIYVLFGLIFLTYVIMTIVINKQEVNNSKKQKLKNKK